MMKQFTITVDQKMITNLIYPKNSNFKQIHNTNAITFKGSDIKAVEKKQLMTEAEAMQMVRNPQTNFLEPNPQTGNLLIHDLVEQDHFSAVKELLLNPEQATKMINAQGKDGKTPIMLAKNERMAVFLHIKGADIDIPDNEGNTGRMSSFLNQELKDRIPVKQNAMATSAELQTKNPSFLNTFQEKPAKSFDGIKTKEPITELQKYRTFNIMPNDPKGMDDVIGMEQIKSELESSLIKPLKSQSVLNKLSKNNTDLPNGILITSASGNGRTHLIKAISAEAKMPIFELTDVAKLDEMVELLEKNFKEKNQRGILLIKGIDNLVGNNTQGGNTQLVNKFNRCLTNSSQRGFLTIATAECKDNVNSTLLKAGKFDRIFNISLPNDNERKLFLAKHLNDKEILENVKTEEEMAKIIERTSGFSTAQLKYVIDETVRKVASGEKDKVTTDDILNEIKTYSKEQGISEIDEYNKTSMYDTELKRYQFKSSDPKGMDDVGGMHDVKSKLYENIIEPWKNKEKTDKLGIKMPDGTCLYGPTGSGKTFSVKAVAKELNVPLYLFDMGEIGTSFHHETGKNIKKIITQLENKFKITGEPSVLLIDEGDTVGQKDAHSSSAQREEFNQILKELDNPGERGIIPILATNDREIINGSLLRDGRLGEAIYVGYQDFDGRLDMIKKALRSKPIAAELLQNEEKLNKLAQDFEDMSNPSITKILNIGLRKAALKDKSLEDGIKEAFEAHKQKELEDILAKQSKSNGNTMKIDKNSTIQYDTKYQRVELPEHIPDDLDGLGGMQELKVKIKKYLISMYSPESIKRFKENRMPIPAGALLVGPSDCGKTTILYTAAKQMGIPAYEISRGKHGSSFINQTENNLNDLFEQCALKFKKTGEMSIVIMNEIEDWFPNKNGFVHQHNVSETNELLKWLEKAASNGIILAGTSNHLEMMEGAATKNYSRLRPIEVGLPDNESRMDIIKKAVTNRPISRDLDKPETIKELSDLFDGHSVGKIAGTINEALLEAIEMGKKLDVNTIKTMVTKLK